MHRLLLLLLLTLGPAADASDLRVWSAGAVEAGLDPVIHAFRTATGTGVTVEYATAPQLRERLATGGSPDLLIAPTAMLAQRADASQPAPLGGIGIGAAIRVGAAPPPLDTLADFTAAVLQADRIVFNRASTGLFLDRLFDRLGLSVAVTPKSVRYATGAEVMRHIAHGAGTELGLAPIPEIRMVREVRYLGALPDGAQNHTDYAAIVLPGAPPDAAALIAWLVREESRATFAAAGIEPP